MDLGRMHRTFLSHFPMSMRHYNSHRILVSSGSLKRYPGGESPLRFDDLIARTLRSDTGRSLGWDAETE